MLAHGGRLRTVAAQYNRPLCDWIDLSTGINPNGWPVNDIPALTWNRLPESDDGLDQIAASYYGTEHLIPVAGSQSAIQLLPSLRQQCHVGILQPSYAEHAYAWQKAGHQVQAFLSVEACANALDQLDVVVIVNPNNPTGLVLSKDLLLSWHQRLSRRNGWLIVDEAFIDATPDLSLATHVGKSGLFLLRSLGKFYGMAGARIGFLLATPEFLTQSLEYFGPWHVNGPARLAAMGALSDIYWQQKTRLELIYASNRLNQLLSRQGLTVAGKTALFCWLPMSDSAFWYDALAKRGILVRQFTEYPGLRIGIPGSETAWLRLEQAILDITCR